MRVSVHNDAVGDLKAIKIADPDAFAKLMAFIQQLRADQWLQSKMLDHRFGDDRSEPISVMKWVSVQNLARIPVWRVKSWDLERQGLKYRLPYVYNYPDKSHNIMAVVARGELDYDDPNHPIRKRIQASCRRDFPGA